MEAAAKERLAGRAGSAFTLAVMGAAIGALGKTCLMIDDTQQPTLTKYDLERIEAVKQKRIRRAARKSPNAHRERTDEGGGQ